MGFLRTFHWLFGWVYIGSKEQAEIDRQKHLKYLMCKQIKESNIKLNKVPYYKPKSKSKRKK
jgi:hypothetical protein